MALAAHHATAGAELRRSSSMARGTGAPATEADTQALRPALNALAAFAAADIKAPINGGHEGTAKEQDDTAAARSPSNRPARSGSAHTRRASKGSEPASKPVSNTAVTTSPHDALTQTHVLRQLLHEHEHPHRPRDAFRALHGCEIILDVLQAVTDQLSSAGGTRHATSQTTESDKQASPKNAGHGAKHTVEETNVLLDLVRSALILLAVALRDHWGNQRHFESRVRGGGWKCLRTTLQSLLDGKTHSYDHGALCDKVFGFVVAAAFDDESLSDLFTQLGREKSANASETAREEFLHKNLGERPFLYLPEMLVIAFDLWDYCRLTDSPKHGNTIVAIPTLMTTISKLSTHTLSAIHRAGILSRVLPLLEKVQDPVQRELKQLTLILLQLGTRAVTDAKYLYDNARESNIYSQILQDAICQPLLPPFVHLDLSLHGYASIELPDLGRNFPPMTSSAGYTLTLWIQVVEFDSKIHTTLFGAFDQSQTCFVLVYLERDTRHLILQTSVTSTRPSVRFKSCTFDAGRWYHICIVHRRPRTTSSSRASLFVDGEFVEQIKAHYPMPPPAPTSTEGDSSSPRPRKHVQAFLGTPQDLATRLGPGSVSLRWRLAAAHLFNEALSDDLIAVYKELGPRYYGNYQDCLGSFQTYQASAALNLRNENLHPGKEEKSDIVAAIRSKAGNLLAEDHVLLSISPVNVLGDSYRNGPDDSALVTALSRRPLQNLRDATRGGRTMIAINGALRSINHALLHQPGIAILTGDPAVVVPTALDEASWTIGGCAPVTLAMLDAAQTREEILRALDVIFGTIRNSWRNSEAMERENGFGVLASLLSSKLQQVVGSSRLQRPITGVSDPDEPDFLYTLLVKVLAFVGYSAVHPEASIINNPLAYRILLIDLDIWRSASPKVQKLYYEQFVTFGVGSKHHVFNSRRLVHMRIVKRWLEALKGDAFYEDTIDGFLTAFDSLLTSSLTAESLRSLALYITYAVHKPKETPTLRSAKSMKNLAIGIVRRSTTPSPQPGVNLSERGSDRPLSKAEVGIRVLGLYAEILSKQDHSAVKKFARTVTNKWLLHLLSGDDSRVIVLAMKILARVLVVNGSGYVEKFADKTGGFTIMRSRLRQWWNKPELWLLCFSILFSKDNINTRSAMDLGTLLEIFPSQTLKVVYPGILPVLISMLQTGLKYVVQSQENPNSPAREVSASRESHRAVIGDAIQGRKRAVSLQGDEPSNLTRQRHKQTEAVRTVKAVTQFLAALHSSSSSFRDFTATSAYVQELLFLLFPVVVSSDIVSPETELNARESSLTFQGSDVIIRPLSQSSQKTAPIVRTSTVEAANSGASRVQPLKRGSSFILVTSEESKHQPSHARLESVASPTHKAEIKISDTHSLVESIMEIVINVFTDQILHRKDFQGIGLFMKVPPGFQEHQAYFESFILRNLLSSLKTTIQLEQKVLWEPRAITSLGRFCHHLDEAVYEGWFIDGADHVLDFIGYVLEYFQQPEIQRMKSVRLCSEIIVGMRTAMARVALLRISETDDSSEEPRSAGILNKLTYWHTVIFAPDGFSDETMRLFLYLLYGKLISVNEAVREIAANLWRLLVVQRAEQVTSVLRRLAESTGQAMTEGLQAVTELDNVAFLSWVDDHRADLDALVFGRLSQTWEYFVTAENKVTQDAYKSRVSKRRDKLKAWANEAMLRDDVIRRHEVNSDHWRANIYAAEHLKRQRSLQDQQDNLAYNLSSWTKMSQQLRRPFGLQYTENPHKWQLDATEGRNRMRLRFVPDHQGHLLKYSAKGAPRTIKPNELVIEMRPKLKMPEKSPIAASPTVQSFDGRFESGEQTPEEVESAQPEPEEDGFEMVDEPETETYEDKNRKVMRSLQRGDQVEHVHNISRIIGLEACEGLLIVGKVALYLIDNFFQRSDGEIVDAAQAPNDERDSYLQLISGKNAGDVTARRNDMSHETRSWRWDDILSISKRRFLFRDVAIELFFGDGQSFLLTIHTPKLRDELYARLMSRAQRVSGGINSPLPEDQWRIDSLRMPEDQPASLGSRFTSVFAQTSTHPATKRWVKGEISNFHYLMLVNTMAGRTYNDLTQYPVFPWVLADYSSKELDLTNPRSFRDLSKPMGCQTPERQAEFRERYQSFADMGDQPPFHYGTHYSSAMIVASYLIRLQPFAQSYLLLQGGSFDHPDRLFYSVEKAWNSASRENMSDVRELIPEFYYLPEMFTNMNSFDFGVRQGGSPIDQVILPPWAHGDPKIFIAKHREALESPYVREHLHQWIDLVFGHKQRGEAALEATNVFHHLSYRGAKNLDDIDDPVERMATIGIIHNFGQTPHQVFPRPHPPVDDGAARIQQLDALVETLTRVPFPVLETPDRIATLMHSPKADRVLCSGPFRAHVPPHYDRFLEWGFADGSARLFATDGHRALGLFEHLHQGHIAAATFADSRTLVTSGTDGVVSVWTLVQPGGSKALDLAPRGNLFGHTGAPTVLAVARAFSTLLTAGADGLVLLWDLNRLALVRALHAPGGAAVHCAAVDDVAGTLLLGHGQHVALYTLNGELLLDQPVCAEGDERVICCAFYEGPGDEYSPRRLLLTGHRRGAVNIWALTVHAGRFSLALVKRLVHVDSTGSVSASTITALRPLPHAVYTGDSEGRVYEWDCIPRRAG